MATRSSKSVAFRGAAAELLGMGGSQVLRLASTLILTRLLFPEAFGIAALMSVLFIGLALLSDAGLEQSVVQNDRGDEQRFLDTVWTIQVLRGLILWAVACLCAWPMAWFFGEPALSYYILVGALGLVAAGFTSTSVFTLRRQLRLERIVGIELVSHGVSLSAIIAWAYIWPSIWAIVVGSVLQSTIRALLSHFIIAGYRNRFRWDGKAAREVYNYGKWIFGSSALTFVSRQCDRFFVAHYAGMAVLGVYSMAVLISDAIGMAVTRLTHGVVFPLLSQVGRRDRALIGAALYRARLFTDAFGLIPLGALMVMSHSVIGVMYDERYQEAGWMLQLLCIRVAMSVVLSPLQTCLFALGFTHYGFYQHAAKSIWLLIGIPIGWHLGGMFGVILVVAMSEVPVLLLLWREMLRRRLLRLSRELLALGLFAIGLLLGWLGNWLLEVMLPVISRTAG
jgi:O-antigen/teichoic acid export membrane protein